MNERRGFRSESGYGMGYRNEDDGSQDRSRYGVDWSTRERQGYDFRDEDRYGRGEPGLWDRMKGELREGWESLTGGDERHIQGRGFGDRGYGRRDYPSAYGYGRGDVASYGYGRNDTDDLGYGSMRGGYGMRSHRDDGRGTWERAREGMREGWNELKESFVGKGPKGYKRSDDRIREDVCEQLTRHPGVDASDIEITVRDGDVTLAGTVPERQMKRIAEDVVEDISGVTDVSNHLRVNRTVTGTSTSTTMSGRDMSRDNGITGTSTVNRGVGVNVTR